ncbi:MAG: MogA/MoaB family molybdenum cofactor biosynthesis protein [Chloroflexi bacterium]|nr:MogA/MoaB family molybdenum cofactor biosynthesis protein [Chloroflexota bacterium]
MARAFTAAVLTVSDKSFRGEREDRGGPAVREAVEAGGGTVTRAAIVPDERDQIAAKLREWSDVDVILTTGGTGLAPRDVTPEATLAVVDRLVPGIAEVMRAESLKKTPAAMLSRAVAGVRGQTLIINLPGSPRGVKECLEAVMPALPHAVETLRGEVGEHTRPERHGH